MGSVVGNLLLLLFLEYCKDSGSRLRNVYTCVYQKNETWKYYRGVYLDFDYSTSTRIAVRPTRQAMYV